MQIRFLLHGTNLLLGLLCAVLCYGQQAGPLLLEKEILLPGVEGRIDHFSADVPSQRVFVAALENGSIEVLDIRRGERTGEIKGLEEPQGVFFDPTTGWIYVATGGDGKLRIYDGKLLTVRETLQFGDDADNIRYDRQTGSVWVGYGNGGIGIVDSTGHNAGSITLGAHPESFQFEQDGDRVFVNVPKQFGIAIVDRKSRTVIGKWAIGAQVANYPMALDDQNKRLFTGCRLPSRLVVLDTNSGRIVGSLATVGDADDIFYDPARHLVYAIGGEGAIDVFRQVDPNHYERLCRIATDSGARTGLFVPGINRLFVAVPHRQARPAKVLVYEVKDKS